MNSQANKPQPSADTALEVIGNVLFGASLIAMVAVLIGIGVWA
jgi:hypothetical protein